MTDLTFDLDAYLDAKRLIADVWCTADVLDIRPDLTDDQAWDVLRVARHRHDANVGLNWDVFAFYAEDLFPAPDADDADGRAEP